MIVALVIILQGIMGFGVVRHVDGLRGAQVLSLSFLVGLPLSSVAVLGMDLASIPLTTASLGLAFSVAVVLTNLGFTARTKKALQLLRPRRLAVKLCDLVFLIVIGILVVISVWQCIRLPVIPLYGNPVRTWSQSSARKIQQLRGAVPSDVDARGALRRDTPPHGNNPDHRYQPHTYRSSHNQAFASPVTSHPSSMEDQLLRLRLRE